MNSSKFSLKVMKFIEESKGRVINDLFVRELKKHVADCDLEHTLRGIYPNIEPQDVEICILIKQGYKIKEIANITRGSIYYVDKRLSRIRKPLGLKSREPFKNFINQL